MQENYIEGCCECYSWSFFLEDAFKGKRKKEINLNKCFVQTLYGAEPTYPSLEKSLKKSKSVENQNNLTTIFCLPLLDVFLLARRNYLIYMNDPHQLKEPLRASKKAKIWAQRETTCLHYFKRDFSKTIIFLQIYFTFTNRAIF